MRAATDLMIAEAVMDMSTATDPKTCAQIFRKTIAAFGVDSFACGEIDLAVRERTVFYALGWPESWRKFYVRSGLVNKDPLLEALKRYSTPFTWSELRRDRKLSSVGSAAMRLLADHGWTEGLAVPIPRGGQHFGLVSLVCQRAPFKAPEKALLAMLSYCFHERARSLALRHGYAVPPANLTRREIDTLRLIAKGATDRAVARTLGISTSTAHEHFETAKTKLKAANRAETIAIAVAFGIVP